MIKRHSLLFFSFFICLFGLGEAFGAACCGGGMAAPALILGDDRALFTTSYAQTRITDDVGSDGVWRRRDGRDLAETWKLEAAHIFQDRWQAGASLPLVRRSRGAEASSGLGDFAATLGYEYLPEWDYHPWRPRGMGYLQMVLPTGKSSFEADSPLLVDTRGRGFLALGAGTMLTKISGPWDFFAGLEAHRSFAKKFATAQASGTLRPGNGGRVEAGGGWNSSALRFGFGLALNHEDAIDVEGDLPSRGVAQRVATGTASASYLFPGEWSATVAYADQTLFGAPVGSSLEKSFAVSLQKRWLR